MPPLPNKYALYLGRCKLEESLEIDPIKADAPWWLVNAPADIIQAIEFSGKATESCSKVVCVVC